MGARSRIGVWVLAYILHSASDRLAVNTLFLYSKILLNVLGQSVVDFCMAGYRLFLSGSRIEVNVVTTARTKQKTSMAQ